MLAASSPRSPSRRFVAALVASAVAHALVTSVMKPGSARGDLTGVSSASPAPRITARLVAPEADPATDPVVLPRETARIEEPAHKPEKTARAVSPAATAASEAASAGPAEIPDPTYYAARQLDVYPALVSALDIRQPDSATSADVKGYVLLLVLIDATGVVDEVSIVEAQPAGQFDDGARHALRSARFRPAMRQGRSVKSRVLIHVNYGSADAGPP
jgi:periplasmic protein TonB